MSEVSWLCKDGREAERAVNKLNQQIPVNVNYPHLVRALGESAWGRLDKWRLRRLF